MGRRSKKSKESDLSCKCAKCGLEHFRNERIRAVPKEGAENEGTICVLVCPKCSYQKYIVLV
jgi:predicted nucleic-acid-binding Zn-ribbon protein